MRNVGSEASESTFPSGASGSADVGADSDCSIACRTADGVLSRTISSWSALVWSLPRSSAGCRPLSVVDIPFLSRSQIGSSIHAVSKSGSVSRSRESSILRIPSSLTDPRRSAPKWPRKSRTVMRLTRWPFFSRCAAYWILAGTSMGRKRTFSRRARQPDCTPQLPHPCPGQPGPLDIRAGTRRYPKFRRSDASARWRDMPAPRTNKPSKASCKVPAL